MERGIFAEGAFYPDQDNGGGEGYRADVNGDGALDTIRMNAAQFRVEVRLNNGDGTSVTCSSVAPILFKPTTSTAVEKPAERLLG